MNNNDFDFFENVKEVTKLIPKGSVTTYGAIANYLGTKKSARMVGWALNQSHNDDTVPAHRVVNRVGFLSGKMHFSTPTEMCERLEKENIKVINDTIVDFDKHFWNPSEELL